MCACVRACVLVSPLVFTHGTASFTEIKILRVSGTLTQLVFNDSLCKTQLDYCITFYVVLNFIIYREVLYIGVRGHVNFVHIKIEM